MENRRPKIWILVLAVLAAAGLVFTFAGASSIKAASDEVHYVQKSSYGDPSAAEGISVRFTNTAWGSGYLTWITDLSFAGGKEQISVSHKYEDSLIRDSGSPTRDEIQIYADLDDAPALRELAEETARGLQVYEETQLKIKVSDYMDYIPVTAQYFVGTRSFNSRLRFDPENKVEELSDSTNAVLSSLFRIKVQDDLTATLRVTRTPDKDGRINFNFDTNGLEKDGLNWAYYNSIYGRYYEGAFYVYLYKYSEDPYTDDLDLEPLEDGSNPYRIYRIPVIEHTGIDDHLWCELDVDSMTVCGEFAEDARVIGRAVSGDGSRAMLMAISGGRFTAYIVDFAQGGKLQTLDLCAAGPYEDDPALHYDVFFKDDYFVLNVDGYGYCVVYPSGGGYALFHAPTDGSVEAAEMARSQRSYWYSGKPYDVKFEDGKLIVASFAGELSENTVNDQSVPIFKGDGISLAIYTKDGLQYYGRWTSTLFDLRQTLINQLVCGIEIR